MAKLIYLSFLVTIFSKILLVSGSFGWKQGYEYLYRVEGRLLTGIPDISSEFSGIQLSHFQRVIPLSNEIIYVKTENLQVEQVHKRLTEEDGDWRSSSGKIKGTKSANFPPEFKEHLTSPMNVVIQNGTVSSIIVQNNLPEWAINIKRSHAADFNLDTTKANLSPGGSFYETVEESLYGRCSVSYTVNENKQYSSADRSNFPLKRDPSENFEALCPRHSRFYDIVKTVNFSSCGMDNGPNSVLYYSSIPEISPDAPFTPSAGALGSLWGRSLDTRYLICSPAAETRFHDYRILRMTQNEQFFSGLRDTEKLIAGSSKTMTLVTVQQFPASFIQKNLEQGNLLKNLRAVLPLPYNFNVERENDHGNLFSALSLTKIHRQEIPKQVLNSLGKISKDLMSSQSKSEVLPQISRVCKLLEKLNYEEIGQIQQQVEMENGVGKEEKEIKQSIFYDSLSMTGSNPAISYVLQSILDRRIQGEQAAQILSTLPLHIRTPTQNLLQLFFQLVTNESQSQVRTSAILAFSTLLNMACINKRIVQNRYPVAQHGEFCNEKLVHENFTPYFQQKFDSELKNFKNCAEQNPHQILTLISAFGNIGNSPILVKNIKKLFEIPGMTSMIKIRALFSLQNIIRQDTQDESIRDEILPFLNSVAFDQEQDSKVRNSALFLLFEAPSSDISWWQKAAMSTWSQSESESESSSDVHSFIYSTISNLARLDGSKNPPVTAAQKERQKKAQSVLKLMKPEPSDGFFDTSKTFYRNGYDESIKSGFSQNLFYFQNEDSSSILPDEIQYSNLMELGNGAGILRPLKWALSGNILTTWTKLVKLYNDFPQDSSRTSRDGDFMDEIFKDFDIEGIRSGKNGDKLEGAIHFKLADQVERLWTFNDETLDFFKKFVTADGGSTLGFNYQKAARLVDHVIAVPTIFGLPIVHRFEVPAFFSLRGQGKIKGDQKPYSMQADVAPLLTWKIERSMSIISPLTSKIHRAGFEQETIFDIPFTGRIRDIPHTCIEMAATPRHLGDSKPKGSIDMTSVSQIPYTAVISDDLERMVIDDGSGGNVLRSIFDPDRPTDFQEQGFGGNVLGMDFNIRVKAPRKPRFLEDPDHEPGSKSAIHLFLRQIFLLTDSSFRHSRFGELLQPKDLRVSERKMSLNLDTSQTKTAYFIMAGGPTQEKIKVEKSSIPVTTSNESTGKSHHIKKSNSSSAKQIFDFEPRQALKEQVVVALVGKTDSLKSISEGNSNNPWNLIGAASQNTFRLLASLQYNSQGDDILGQLALGQTAQDAAYYLPLKSSKAFHWIHTALLSPVPLDGRWSRDKGVIQGQLNLKYPEFIRTDGSTIHLLRDNLLANPLTLDIWAGVKAGLSLHLLLPVMTLQGFLKRSDAMTKWAKDLSPEAKTCKKDIESKNFTTSPACMKVTKEQAGALNEVELNLQQTVSTSTSDDLILQIEDLLKAVFYTKMSQVASSGAAGIRPSIQISGRHIPDVSHISFQLQKSAYTLRFDNVETHPLLLRLLPLRVDQNPVKVVKGLLFFLPESNLARKVCSVEAFNVQTFNKLSYIFDEQWISNRSNSNSNLNAHVLTMDCSRQFADAVLLHNLETRGKRHVTILLEGQTTIQIQFGSSSISNSRSRSRSTVWVNGKNVQLPFKVKRSSQSQTLGSPAKEIAEIVNMVNGDVQVKGQRLKVIADGQRVIILKSRALNGRTCGICDSSPVHGLRRPFQNFRFSSVSPLPANFELNSLN